MAKKVYVISQHDKCASPVRIMCLKGAGKAKVHTQCAPNCLRGHKTIHLSQTAGRAAPLSLHPLVPSSSSLTPSSSHLIHHPLILSCHHHADTSLSPSSITSFSHLILSFITLSDTFLPLSPHPFIPHASIQNLTHYLPSIISSPHPSIMTLTPPFPHLLIP